MKCFFGFRPFFIFLCGVMLTLFGGNIIQTASASCDFNNDGFDDIAVGIPTEDINGLEDAGAVQVIYGRPGGLSATNNQFWHLGSPNVLGDPQELANFGSAVACGDFNGDNRDDLAVGSPFAKVAGAMQAGMVSVLYASNVTGRLSGKGDQLWTQNSPGILETAEFFDHFGFALATGDFNGDGFADLAIGAASEEVGGKGEAGGVHILYGSSKGLSAAGNQFWTQDSAGISGQVEGLDEFGHALVAADFGRDTSSGCYDDLAIGAPRGSEVNVIYGSASGLTFSGNQLLKPLVLDGSFFGARLAAGSFRQLDSICGTKKIADLVVGTPGDILVIPGNPPKYLINAGSVTVIYGTNSGLTNTDRQIWSHQSAVIADKADFFDEFGYSLAAGYTTSTGEYLVIAEQQVTTSAGVVEGAGAIHILYTDPSTGLLTSVGSNFYHQDTPGIKDKLEDHEVFGFALATGDFNSDGEDDLVVGVPGEDLKGVPNVGAINVLYSAGTSTTQFFHQNTEDMKDVEEPNDGFGTSLSP